MAGEAAAVGRVATSADVPAVVTCLASAFYDDPLWGHWTFPDESRRKRNVLPFMTRMAQAWPDQTWMAMTAAGESVTVWTPPDVSSGTPEQRSLISHALDELFGPRAPAVHALFEQFEEHLPEGRYYHLEWWATQPEYAGRGLGGALIRENLTRVDAEHLPTYLESTNPKNLPRYEALRFRRIGEFAPPDGPTVTTMWRDPRG